MTAVHFNRPLELAGSMAHTVLGPCVVCAMNAKGEQVTATRERWQAAQQDDDRKAPPVYIPWSDSYGAINDAVIVAINDMFPGLLMPVCWDHCGAIAPADPAPLCTWCNGTGHKKTGLEAARGPLPPGFGNGSHKRGRG